MKNKPSGAGSSATVPPPLPNRDIFHRVNFAYQSAALLQQLVPGPSTGLSSKSEIQVVRDKKGKRKAVEWHEEVVAEAGETGNKIKWGRLARKGTREMKRMALHNQVKL